MSEIITEERDIVGFLFSQGETYELLELEPTKHNTLPWWYKEHAFQFFVVSDGGFAKYIIVGRGGFVVEPHIESYKKSVSFVVEGEDEAEKTNVAPVENEVV